MAGQFDVNGARQAGYSDADIVNFLSSQPHSDFDYNGALKAGYSPEEILSHVHPQPSGVVDSLAQGLSDVPGGIAKTIKTHLGAGPVSNALEDAAQSTAPDNFKQAPLYDEQGFHPGNIPARLAQSAPSMATALAAARMTPGPWWAKVLGGAAAGTLMSAGNEAQTAADKRTGTPGTTPTHEDLVRGDLTAAGENAVSALPITRFLPGTGAVTKTGAKGVANALKNYAVSAGEQGLASAGSNVVGQVGQSVGTPGGVSVDPTQAIDAGASGVATGGLFGAKNFARDSLNAMKYREVTPELQTAATQFANRMQEHADGRNLDAGVIFGGKAQRTGAEVFNKANQAVRGELKDAVKDLRSRVQLPTEAQNVLDAAMSGHQPTEREYGTLTNALQGDPQAANVLNLVRQSHVADIVKNSGHLGDSKFTGGISSHVGSALTGHNIAKTALVAGGAAALEEGAGHLIAYSPEIMAALAAGKVLANVGDNLTGARSPAGRFVRAFGDGTTPTRLGVNTPPPPPPPPGGGGGPGPTGPSVPPIPQPWGSTPPGQPFNPTLFPQAAQQFKTQSIGPLRALAKAANSKTARVVVPSLAHIVGGHLMGELGGQLAGNSAHVALDHIAKLGGETQPAPAQVEQQAMPLLQQLAAQSAPPPDMAKVITRTRALVRGLQQTQKLKQRTLGENQADEVASGSPLIDRVGGPDVVANPDAGKRMAAMVSAAKALQQLQQDRGVLPGRVTGAAQTVSNPQQSPKSSLTPAVRIDGQIFTGANHALAASAAEKTLGPDMWSKFRKSDMDGFQTSDGRYVDRAEAFKIANATGQLKTAEESGRAPWNQRLTSEDLKVSGVSKGNGKIETKATNGKGDEYVIPQSPYAHLPTKEAADAIAKDAEKAGNVKFLGGFRSATMRNIDMIRNAAVNVGADLTNNGALPAKTVAAQFEGVRSQKEAIAHREYLKKTYPQVAGALDRVFSDEVIKRIWKRKG